MREKKKFTPEYKKEIIRLVSERGKKVSEVAKDIGLTPTSVRRWIKQYSVHGDGPHAVEFAKTLREELENNNVQVVNMGALFE